MAEKYIPRLKRKYNDEVVESLRKEFDYKNIMQVPRMKKIVLNIGLGEAIANPKVIEDATSQLAQIVGQKPVITKAKKSISAFKLREEARIGAMVTLRGNRMWDFFDRLVSLAIPRMRDFRGISTKSFDGRGNFTMGIKEQIIFPEINYDKIDKVRGMNVSIVTSGRTDEEAKTLLGFMGMPFRRN
ncbi:MAG: 50S ribosomal protein L5 [Pseudomonadota bacterium]